MKWDRALPVAAVLGAILLGVQIAGELGFLRRSDLAEVEKELREAREEIQRTRAILEAFVTVYEIREGTNVINGAGVGEEDLGR